MIATTPKPPYYAVIFTSVKSKNNKGYYESVVLDPEGNNVEITE